MTQKNVLDMTQVHSDRLHEDDEPSLSSEGVVRYIRLRRPARHNRLQVADMLRLRELVASVRRDPAARVLVLAAGGKSFSAGFDLSASAAGQGRESDDFPEVHLQRLCDDVEALPLPTVCAINGGVYGGGTDLALACDFRIGVRSTKLRMPAVQLGVCFYPSGIYRYVTRLGLGTSKRLFLAGEELGAGELQAAGFLDYVVEDKRTLDAAVKGLAERLAAMPPDAAAWTKQALNRAARGQLDADEGQRAFLRSLSSDEFASALEAWSSRKSQAKVQQ
jgi:enoyl-CoA hydratase